MGLGFELSDGDALGGEEILNLTDGEFAVVEDTGGEDGIGLALEEDVSHVLEVAGAAAGDDGDSDVFTDAAGDFDIVAGFGAIGVDAIEDNFSGAEFYGVGGPGDRVPIGGFTASGGEDLPVVGTGAAGVDGDDDALAAELFCALADEFRGSEGGGVDADFVGARPEHGVHMVDRTDSAADGEGHEALVGDAFDDIDHGGAAVGGGGDVEEDHFVGALFVVAEGEGDGVTDIFEAAGFGFAELDAAGDVSIVDIEAGYDASCEHGLGAVWPGEGVIRGAWDDDKEYGRAVDRWGAVG